MANILLIDDDPEIRQSLSLVLRRLGHECATADGVDNAIKAAGTQSFDLTVSDYRMPGRNGLQALSQLKEIQPACARILMSGELQLPMIMDAVNHGEIHRVLEKPVSAPEFRALVEQVLRQRRKSARLESVENQRKTLEEKNHLRACLGDKVRIALQPIVYAESGSVYAYEALLRSGHPVLSNPLAVLGAAERQDMVNEVADVVVKQAAHWLSKSHSQSRLFLNLHPREFAQPEHLLQRLSHLAPHADRVILEITERSRVTDFSAWQTTTGQLRELGFRMAVDDLGAGYSSLSVLAELVPEFIKLDMSIVRNVHADRHKRCLVELLCRFAHSSQATIVAEGIEDKAEADALTDCGVHLLQGFWFGKPDFPPLLTQIKETTTEELD